jgi:class 3 adenylate cyclase
MSETKALFDILRQTADGRSVDAIERLVRDGSDRDLCRINALSFATAANVDVEHAIAAFLHASRIGLFDLSWNMLCPGCGGVLDAGASLKTFDHEKYDCALCSAAYEPTLDEMVEVTFTVNPRVRKIAAHDPDTLPFVEYCRQVFWSSGIDLPDDLEQHFDEFSMEALELPPGEKALVSLQLPTEFIIVFDPVTHATQFIDIKGEPTKERQSLTIVFNVVQAPTGTVEMRPGPLRLALENRTHRRVLPSVWIANHVLHDMLGKRKPFLTAKRLLTNQTFRDIYRTDTLDVDQRLKITSLTFLFTDLKGSTELYEKVGDLVAYDLVRQHFRAAATRSSPPKAGAVVKTIGDAVMATFPTPDRAHRRRAPHARRHAEDQYGAQRHAPEPAASRSASTKGSCLAVTLQRAARIISARPSTSRRACKGWRKPARSSPPSRS